MIGCTFIFFVYCIISYYRMIVAKCDIFEILNISCSTPLVTENVNSLTVYVIRIFARITFAYI